MSNNERYSNKSTKQRYFDRRPDVVKIFEDLEAFHNFCRIEMLPFNEADLYNKHSRVWQSYEKGHRVRKPWNNNRPNTRVNKPRSH